MKRSPRGTGLFPLLLTLATVVAGLSAWRAAAATTSARSAEALLADCRRLAARIEATRDRPTRAEENRRAEGDLARQIERWCEQSGIPAKEILRIDPVSPRRAGDSDYVQQGARVQFRSVTLPQLAAFADATQEGETSLAIETLRLTAPRSETDSADSGEAWAGEFTLTYLVYTPKSSR